VSNSREGKLESISVLSKVCAREVTREGREAGGIERRRKVERSDWMVVREERRRSQIATRWTSWASRAEVCRLRTFIDSASSRIPSTTERTAFVASFSFAPPSELLVALSILSNLRTSSSRTGAHLAFAASS